MSSTNPIEWPAVLAADRRREELLAAPAGPDTTRALVPIVGDMSRAGLMALEDALRDAATREFARVDAAFIIRDDAARAYHRARWQDLTDAADYVEQQLYVRASVHHTAEEHAEERAA